MFCFKVINSDMKLLLIFFFCSYLVYDLFGGTCIKPRDTDSFRRYFSKCPNAFRSDNYLWSEVIMYLGHRSHLI